MSLSAATRDMCILFTYHLPIYMVSAGIRNNLTSWCTGYLHEHATAEPGAWNHRHLGNNFSADPSAVPSPHL